MSDRGLYKKVPLAKRVCSWVHCQDQIQRNIIKSKDGRLWHYGCFINARDAHFQCKECFATYDGTEVNFIEGGSGRGDTFRQEWIPTCPSCGSHLKNPYAHGVIET